MNTRKYIIKKYLEKITDNGIGSNRLLRSNNYLNDFNIFNKNSIKMNKLRQKIYEEKKLNTIKLKKKYTMPEMIKCSKCFPKENFNYKVNTNHSYTYILSRDIKSQIDNNNKIEINKSEIMNDDLFDYIKPKSKITEINDEENINNINKENIFFTNINIIKALSQTINKNKEINSYKYKTNFPFYENNPFNMTPNRNKTISDKNRYKLNNNMFKNSFKLNKKNNFKNFLFDNSGNNNCNSVNFFKNIKIYKNSENNENGELFLEKKEKNGGMCDTYGNESSKNVFVYNPLIEKIINMSEYHKKYKDIEINENRYDKINICKYKIKPLKPLKLSRNSNFDKFTSAAYELKKSIKNPQ